MQKLLQAKSGVSDSGVWLFAGLGNPGDQYKNNRHNIGFMVVDSIAQAHDFPPFKTKYQGLLSEGKIDGSKIILLKPQTYMNNSGQSVAAAAKFYKIPPERILVFHDELDLEPGKIRIKCGGGNAGHNGLKSIQAHLGTPDFWRVRMGIGHPGDKDRVHSYVLGDFAKAERPSFAALLDECARHAGLLAAGAMDEFMSKVAAAG